ncbi:site-specific DNA-methyltransferase [Fontimonas sp. SYSU GA230001]|uniref:site-specific DNA-methyltransferase n=1 Tax=Fontimonas sp. SYSU GA230001 TaxID=3142450 RepID=UPI0032B32FDE
MSKPTAAELQEWVLDAVPKDGSGIGNQSLAKAVIAAAASRKQRAGESEVQNAVAALVDAGTLVRGKGRGGSVRRAQSESSANAPAPLELQAQEIPEEAKRPKERQTMMSLPPRQPGQPTRAAAKPADGAKVISYRHDQTRKNNPDVGVVTPETDPEQPKTTWAYDPHIDPALQFDIGRAQIEKLIDDALASGDQEVMRAALEQLKRQAAPYLNWTGKAERTSFEVDTVSLHVHERIDPATILSAVQKQLKQGKASGAAGQGDFFQAWFEKPLPLREAIEFYKHDRGWSNRLISGDSLLVMNSLLQKEGMAGQVQMIYIDPPYGIKYGSNFQPFVNKRDVKDRKDEDLTQEPEQIRAFRDTWELGIHSYLTYLRDRLLLAKELLHESGSVFVQISDENLHHVREILDEVLGAENFCSVIQVQKTGSQEATLLATTVDFLVWYAKDKKCVKYHQLYLPRTPGDKSFTRYDFVELPSGAECRLSRSELYGEQPMPDGRQFRHTSLISDGQSSGDPTFRFRGREFRPKATSHWKTTVEGLGRLAKCGRVEDAATTIRFKRYLDDFPVVPVDDRWESMQIGKELMYVVQTPERIIERCLLMTTDPGDLVLDPTCGSGTTAFVAEKWGRRWISCDTSRVAVTLAKQRLMTASYDYYELKYPHEGLKGGFIYKTVPHVTLKSIANNPEIDEIYARMHPAIEQALGELNKRLDARLRGHDGLREWEVPFDFPEDWPQAAKAPFEAFHAARQAMQKRMDQSIAAHADQETLYDQPQVSRDKLRITGPFTVEAVPFPTVLALDESAQPQSGHWEADASIARSGESARQHGWRDELMKTGIRGKNGQMLKFAELETLPALRHLHCTGTLKDTGERVVVSFGPEHAALEQRQVEMAMREAGELFPRPKMIVFCAFTFDPEAAKDIDNTKGIVALKAQMNTDLLTDDLKKARASNQSFWLMGQPDVEVRERKDGRYEVEVHGFDYFDTAKGELVSGGKSKIAAWSLDTDYDERSLFPRQVFFPMAGAKDGWNKLKRDIKAELNEALLDKLHGTVSLPFAAGENRKIAVKIVDDRGIESLKVIPLA